MPSDRNAHPSRLARPPAAAMIEALRGLGYSIGTAIADLIDNSISANANNVWLTFHWAGSDSKILIVDDGDGMDDGTLVQALVPGSRHPAEYRDPRDLGRFGLGLKTASFSQCRKLSVASRRAGEPIVAWRWDLDHVTRTDDWYLLPGMAAGSERDTELLESVPHGTVVVWEQLDRVVGSTDAADRGAHDAFLARVEHVEQHLAMVFHRFLEGTSPRLRLFINGRSERESIRPWDPFLRSHSATQATPVETIRAPTGEVELQGYVLPHKDRLTHQVYESAAGPGGWISQQGFYVYRNSRLLMPGGWLGLGDARPWTREEPYKLARLRLDVRNTADVEWKVDIRKSVAHPPDYVRPRLCDLARHVRNLARRVFVQRGVGMGDSSPSTFERAWTVCSADQRGARYRVNRLHPAVADAMRKAQDPHTFEAMLRVLEETVPVDRIWLDAIEAGQTPSSRFSAAPQEDVKRVLALLFKDLRLGGLSPDAARRRLLVTEPFQNFPDLVAQLLE